MSELDAFREAKDRFFRNDPSSPLTAEQRASFDGLSYYPEAPTLVVSGPLDTNVDPTPVSMATTTGGERIYRRAGVLHFRVEAVPAQVTLYASEQLTGLFLPFRDATSGVETYGAGRYLDLPDQVGGDMTVDFNYAYNPYCAYNDAWSCPLPPIENWLSVPIRAGEKTFPKPV